MCSPGACFADGIKAYESIAVIHYSQTHIHLHARTYTHIHIYKFNVNATAASDKWGHASINDREEQGRLSTGGRKMLLLQLSNLIFGVICKEDQFTPTQAGKKK